MLIIGRIFFGTVTGMSNGITPIFLAEISPAKMRGALGVLHQLTYNIGIVVASIVGLPELLTSESRWIYLYLIDILPIAAAFGLLPLIPETPRYLYLVRTDLYERLSVESFCRRQFAVYRRFNFVFLNHLHNYRPNHLL